MYSIVECGGFQFKVAKGDQIKVPLLNAEPESEITLERVLLTSDGENTLVGTPTVGGASVKATVVGHGKGDKILVVKKKRRKDYKRKNGHRQPFTTLMITELSAS